MGKIKKAPSEGGSGGKRGHSNMEHWLHTDEIKNAVRMRRRVDDRNAERDSSEQGWCVLELIVAETFPVAGRGIGVAFHDAKPDLRPGTRVRVEYSGPDDCRRSASALVELRSRRPQDGSIALLLKCVNLVEVPPGTALVVAAPVAAP